MNMYDSHDIYVAAQAQLEGEGIDADELRDARKGTHIAFDLLNFLLRQEANGTLEVAAFHEAREALKKLRESELHAIVEEIEASQHSRDDALYDAMREEGFGQ